MELDREKERRVWERVQAGLTMPPLKGDSVRGLEKLALENGAALLKLSRQVPGKTGEKLRRLSQEQTRLGMAVRGLGHLRNESALPSPAPAAKEPPRRVLAGCLGRCREFGLECSHRATDPEQGTVFAALSRQAAEQAVTMLEVLGEMEKIM